MVATVWIRDPHQVPSVWHVLVRWQEPAVCGRLVAFRRASVWPVYPGDPGPQPREPCGACIEAAAHEERLLPKV